VSVAVEPHGEPVGVREKGGALDIVMHEIEVECLPASIPESIRVDVSSLDVGQDLRLGAVELPEGVSLLGDPDAVVLRVVLPTEITEEEGLEQPAAEPELIGREEGQAERDEAEGGEPGTGEQRK